MTNGLVSIIVPVYNVEAYIHRCVQSILKQTYSYIELILIDDGSLDQSLTICKEYAKGDSRITVLHKKNGGVSSARNTGLSVAKGDYILFVDSDDYIREDMVEKMMGACNSQTALVMCELCRIASDEKMEASKIKEDSVETIECLSKGSYINYLETNWGPTCKLYRRDIIGKIKFPEAKIAEDMFFNVKLICDNEAFKVSILKMPLYFYVQHIGSAMNSNYDGQYLDALNLEVEAYEMLKKEDIHANKLIKNGIAVFFSRFARLSFKYQREKRADYLLACQVARKYRHYLISGNYDYKYILVLYMPRLYLFLYKIRQLFLHR